ncbi:MAG: hypothetical protein CEN87_184 [Parcubacteria group bacterium Licking1014_1]|nr:MAG: hypothetical protein CEN87_184 [Parcubacteria group bacterium Licking1014_1]
MFKKVLKYLKYLKYIGIVILAVLVFYAGAEAGFQTKHWLDFRKADKEAQNFNESVLKIFQEDIYGGKTPEETFNLFVIALKNEDVDLAIKYIVLDIERRQNYWNEFNAMKQKGELKAYAEAFPKWEEFEQKKDDYNDWEKRAMVEYGQIINKSIKVYDPYLKKETIIPPGNYGRSIILIKNINNIWKIESF